MRTKIFISKVTKPINSCMSIPYLFLLNLPRKKVERTVKRVNVPNVNAIIALIVGPKIPLKIVLKDVKFF